MPALNQTETLHTTLDMAQDRLRKAGYRVTRQRLAVYSFLNENEAHPTVDDIYAAVRERFPKVSVATIYKSVDSLVDVGLVKPIYLGHAAATRFDASTETHGHFRCIACNEITDIPVSHEPEMSEALDHCEIVGSTVEFYGYCRSCQTQKLASTP